jgi:hypothetical protein
MNDPIIVWPPGSFGNCGYYGNYYDCTYDYPEYAAQGSMVCCPVG